MAERPFEQIMSAPSAGQAQPRHLQKVAERGQIHVFPCGVELCIGRLALFPGREDRVRKVRDAAVEVGGGIGDLESIGKPAELAFQIGKLVVELTHLKARDLALEGAGQRTPAFEEMEHAVESSFARERVVLFREEELAHALEVDRRLHLVLHLRPLGNIGIAGNHRLRAVAHQEHPLEMDVSAVDAEHGLHRHVHRHVVLDPDRAAVECRLAAIAGKFRDRDVEIARDGAPWRAVIVERDRAVPRPHVLHRRDEPLGAVAAAHVELREAVDASCPLLDDHVPVGHFDRVDEHLAMEHGVPRKRDVDALCGDEWAVFRLQPADGKVFEDELAGEQTDAEPADAHRPADALRPFALGEGAQPWTEIDGQRRHDRHRERHRQRGDTEPRKAEREVRSDALEALEPKRHLSPPKLPRARQSPPAWRPLP